MFEHLTIVEFAQVLAGPAVGQFFAELGARVIKIENPNNGGDMTRKWRVGSESEEAPVSAYYASINWGKKVQMIDLKSEAGLAAAQELVRDADVVLSNFLPGQDARLQLDPKSLLSLKPDLIIGRINGYGPDSKRGAYDVVLQAESGFMGMNGTEESGPVKMPVALIDLLAAHQLKEGLLLALLQKQQTGKGAVVDVSLYDAALASLANQASNWLMAGHLPTRLGSKHPNIAPYGDVFTTKDQRELVLAVGTDKQFKALCKAIQLDHLATDAAFERNPDRVKNRTQLVEKLTPAFRLRFRDELLKIFEANGVPAGGILHLDEVFDQPEAQQLVLEQEQEGVPCKSVRTAVFQLREPDTFFP